MPILPNVVPVSGYTAPGAYITIVPPAPIVQPASSDVVGLVGTAIWGPQNAPVAVGSYAQYVSYFGQLQTTATDMGTYVAIAGQNGASAFQCVRVTDGTAVKASATLNDAAAALALTFTAMYEGTLGNEIAIQLIQNDGGSWMLSVRSVTLGLFEQFGPITGSGNAFWVNAAAAINNGQSLSRGPSQLVTCAASASTGAPAAKYPVLSGGTNGGAVSADDMLGVGASSSSSTGAYSLIGTGVSYLSLCGNTDTTSFSVQSYVSTVLGAVAVMQLPAGTSISSAYTTVAALGITDWWMKILDGNWVYWDDTVNQINRLVPSAPFWLGVKASRGPNASALNKPLQAVVATQRSQSKTPFSFYNINYYSTVGLDTVIFPSPGGNYFSFALDNTCGTAGNPAETDAYATMSWFLAKSFEAFGGQFVGKGNTDAVRVQVRNAFNGFLQMLANDGVIGSAVSPKAYQVICDNSNNSAEQAVLGYLNVNVTVAYAGIIKYFAVNLDGSSANVILGNTVSQ